MICGTNLPYDPKSHYRHVAGAVMDYYASENREEGLQNLKTFLDEVFRKEDAKAIFDWVLDNNGKLFPRDFGVAKQTVNLNDPMFLETRAAKTVLEYFADYGGNPTSDTEDLQTNMDTELVFMLVYDPNNKTYFQPNSADTSSIGYTLINRRLREKRLNLAKKIIENLKLSALEIDVNIDNDIEYTSFINQTIVRAQAELEKRRILNKSISPEVRKQFIMLNCFDELLENSGFVQIKNDSNILTKDRYVFTGETIDYGGGSQFEEHADSEKYTSKLVKIILSSLKTNGSNETINLKGFQTAMSYAVEWALSGKNASAFMAATNPDKSDFHKIITLFNTYADAPRLVKQALTTIKGALFAEDVPIAIKQLFSAQAATTVRSVYFEYSLGTFRKKTPDGKISVIPGVVCRKAEDKILDESLMQVVDTMIVKMKHYSQNDEAKKKLIRDYGISFKNNKVTFSPWSGVTIVIEKNPEGNFVFSTENMVDYGNPQFNKNWETILQDLLDIPLTNVSKYNQILTEIKFLKDGKPQLIGPFEQVLGGILWAIGSPNGISEFQNPTKPGEYHYGKLFKLAADAGNFLNHYFNSEFNTVVKDLQGHNLPPHQMGSLGYRTKHLIAEIRRNPNHVKSDNFFVKNFGAIGQTILREGINVNGRIKNSSDLGSNEVLLLQAMTDVYNSLLYPPMSKDGQINTKSIYLQPMVYSDKTRHILKEIILDGLKFTSGEKIDTAMENLARAFGLDAIPIESKFIKEINIVRGKEARKTLEAKLRRFAKAFNITVDNGILSDETLSDLLNKVNKRLSEFSNLDEIATLFREREITFYEENDVNESEVGFEINPLLVHHFRTFALGNSESYFNFVKAQFAFDLAGDRFRMDKFLDPSIQRFIKNTPADKAKSWINSNSGNVELFKIYDTAGKEVLASSAEEVNEKGYTVVLNPILNTLFWAHNFFGQQIRTIQMGADYNIKGSGGDWLNDTDARFVAQSKRAMGQGSTVLKFDTSRTYGMPNECEGAVFEGPELPTYNPKGHSKKGEHLKYDSELVADGYGNLSPIEFVLEQWSLPGNVKLKSDNEKTIIQYIDEEGNLQQIKWAASCLSNESRRSAPHSDGINQDRMFKLMHNKHRITVNFNLTKFYGNFAYTDEGHQITYTDKLYFYDIESGKYYRIDSVSSNPITGEITRTTTEVDADGKEIGPTEEKLFKVNSIYDLHELFGGKWCKEKQNGTLVYSEANNTILANIVCSEKLKNKFVHYAISKSAMKVGMNNVNPTSIFFKNSTSDKLLTIKMIMSHSGVQLDAGHEVAGGEVTEMSQLVSLLIEKGFCTDIVEDIYNNIASVTKAGLDKFKDASKLKTIISETLVGALRNNSNVKSIADDFIKQMVNKVKTEGVELRLPLSSPTVKNKFATAICSTINSQALRRRYPGLGTIQTASYDQVMFHDLHGYTYTYEEVVNKYRDVLKAKGFDSIDWLFDDKSTYEDFISDDYVAIMQTVVADLGPTKVPAVELINPEGINFEDTIIYRDSTGRFVSKRIVHISDYYKFRYGGYGEIYRWNIKPRNLVQQISWFKTLSCGDQDKYSIYDIDVARAIQYLGVYGSWQHSSDRQQIEDFLFQFTGRRGQELDAYLGTVVYENDLKRLQDELQDLLRNFHEGMTVSINGELHTIVNIGHKPADIMGGNPWHKQINWRESDSIGDVQREKEQFFANRLKETFALVPPREVNTTGYDAILYEPDGTPILVQFGGEENQGRLDPSKLTPSNSFSKNTGELRYKGENLGNVGGFSEFIYTSANKQFRVIRLKDHTRINNWMKTKLFSEIRFRANSRSNFGKLCDLAFKNKVVNGIATRDFYIGKFKVKKGSDLSNVFNTFKTDLIPQFNAVQEQKVQKRFENLAKQQWLAFEKLLNVVGTRIPSQALQSCAACRYVAFTGASDNKIYVPRILTWCAGSDYDIDKFFIMMYGILENGTLPNLSGISNPNYDGVSAIDLPDAPGVEFDLVIEPKIEVNEFGDPINLLDPDAILIYPKDIKAVISNENGEGIKVLTRIANEFKQKQNPTLSLIVPVQAPDAESQLVENLASGVYELEEFVNSEFLNKEEIEEFLETLNEYSLCDLSVVSKYYRETAEKNMVMNSMFKALTSSAVQLGLQSPVSMSQAKAVAAANTFEKIYLNPDNPRSIVKQQQDNMIGKVGIASVAVAQKSFNGISFSFNATVKTCAETFNVVADSKDSNIKSSWLKQLFSVLIQRKDGGIMTIANINFRDLIAATKDKPLMLWENMPSEWAKYIKENRQFIPNVYVTSQEGDTIVEYINIHALAQYIQEIADRTDAIDLFSNIMSCATDNAKELLLAKLNAVGDNLDLYTYLFATGYSFQEAASIIMSDAFRLVHKYREQSIFVAESQRVTQENTLDFILDNDHLSIINKPLLNAILTYTDKHIGNLESISESNHFISYLFKNNKNSYVRFIKFIEDKLGISLNSNDIVETLQRIAEERIFTSEIIKEFMMQELHDFEVQQLILKWLSFRISQKSNSKIDEFEVEVSNFDMGQNDDDTYNFEEIYSERNYKYVNISDASLDDLQYIYKYLEYYLFPKNYDLHVYKQTHPMENVQTQFEQLLELTSGAKELATLGRKIFSINQGMKVGDYEEWHWVDSINADINKKFVDKLDEFEPFDLIKFMNDQSYANRMIDQYEKAKDNINILDVFYNSPHFKAMVESAMTARMLLEQSVSLKKAREIGSKIKFGTNGSEWNEIPTIWKEDGNPDYKSITRTMSVDEWRALSTLINENVILEFFRHLPNDIASLTIPSDFEGYVLSGIGDNVTIKSGTSLKHSLNNIAGIATFIKWMDEYYIPKLRKELRAKGNLFADMLVQTESRDLKYKTSKVHWNINKNVRNAKIGEALYDIKSQVISDFGEIMRDDSELQGFKIGDLFYIYNLLNYHDSNSGMTFLFSNAAASGNTSDWVDAFETYVTDLDDGKITDSEGGELLHLTPKDVLFVIVDAKSAWKYQASFDPTSNEPIRLKNGVAIKKPLFLNNSHFPFRIISAYEGIKDRSWTGFKPFKKSNVHISGQEVLHEVVSRLNPMLQASGIRVVEIDDTDLDTWEATNTMMFENISQFDRDHIRNARGFVYNGVIYINTTDKDCEWFGESKGMIATLMHECVHLIAANLHYNPKYRSKYIQSVKNLWDSASENTKNKYRTAYPNKHALDLMEEYFADTLGNAFAENFEGEFRKVWEKAGISTPFNPAISVGQLKHDVAKTISELFGLIGIDENVDFSKLGGTNITDLLKIFGSTLFDFGQIGFTTTSTVLTQELATVKDDLINDNKIIEMC